MIRVSVCVAVEDDDQDLAGCIQSCGEFADEIVVLERSGGANVPADPRVRHHPLPPEETRTVRELAEEQTTGEWILLLGADERVAPTLERKILGLLEHGRMDEFRAFEIRRRHWVCGRPMRTMNLQPDYPCRLFARPRASEDGEFKPTKPLGRLEQTIERTLVSRIDNWLRRRERAFRDAEACDTSAWRLALRPPLRFLSEFVGHGGWRDRRAGLIWAGLLASEDFLAAFYRWQKTLETSRPRSS